MTKRFGELTAVDHVDLTVRAGEIYGFLGPNGSGKTTFLRMLCGLLRADDGSGKVLDYDVIAESEAIKREVGYMTQRFSFWEDLTIEENLAMGAYRRNDKDGIASDMEKYYDLFPRLKERRKQSAGTLSGGEQQMLAIARALMSRPKLLLLDEPSMGLAPLMVEKIFSVVRDIAQQGVTLLLVEQNAKLALEVSNTAYVMESGLITLSDKATQLLNNPQVRHAYLGE